MKTSKYLLIILCIIVAISLLFTSCNKQSADQRHLLSLLVTEDEVYLVTSNKTTLLLDDKSDLLISSKITAMDESNFYVIEDIELNEQINKYTGDLVYVNSNKKRESVDKDVIAGSLNQNYSTLWYAKEVNDQLVICSLRNNKILEVSDKLDEISNIMGSTDGKSSYYMSNDNLYFVENKESIELVRDIRYASPVSMDSDHIIALTFEGELYLCNSEENIPVFKDVRSYKYNPETMDFIVLDSSGTLHYCPFNDSSEILSEKVVSSLMERYDIQAGHISSDIFCYLNTDSEVFAVSLNNNSAQIYEIAQNIYDIFIWRYQNYYIVPTEDNELVIYDYKNHTKSSIKIDDYEENLSKSILEVNNQFTVYRNKNQNISIISNETGELLKIITSDIERIILIDDQILYIDDKILVLENILDDTYDNLYNNVHSYRLTENKEIYALTDLSQKDGGDLILVSLNGKIEKIMENVISLRTISYYK